MRIDIDAMDAAITAALKAPMPRPNVPPDACCSDPEYPCIGTNFLTAQGMRAVLFEAIPVYLQRSGYAALADAITGEGLHAATGRLVIAFAAALARKLRAAEKKYGYSDGWLDEDWMDACRAKLRRHVEKGDPLDVAAYAAFLWHHNQPTRIERRAAGASASAAAARLRSIARDLSYVSGVMGATARTEDEGVSVGLVGGNAAKLISIAEDLERPL